MTSLGNLGSWVGLQPKPEPTFMDKVNDSFSLSYTKRLVVFVTLMLLGIFFCILSTYFIVSPTRFAKFYTVGSLLMLISTFFLMGPINQLKSMFGSRDRLVPSSIYIISIFGTLYTATQLQSSTLTLVMVLVQFGAAVVYAVSYLPFGSSMLMGAARSVLPL